MSHSKRQRLAASVRVRLLAASRVGCDSRTVGEAVGDRLGPIAHVVAAALRLASHLGALYDAISILVINGLDHSHVGGEDLRHHASPERTGAVRCSMAPPHKANADNDDGGAVRRVPAAAAVVHRLRPLFGHVTYVTDRPIALESLRDLHSTVFIAKTTLWPTAIDVRGSASDSEPPALVQDPRNRRIEADVDGVIRGVPRLVQQPAPRAQLFVDTVVG